MKRVAAAITILCVFVNALAFNIDINSASANENLSLELKVNGTKVVLADDMSKEVRLVGVNLPDLHWSNEGDGASKNNLAFRMQVALDTWKANVVRLAVDSKRWFGQGDYQNGNYEPYRTLVDELINMASVRGKYVILDLHRFEAPREIDLNFWKDAAARYKNNPTVLFGLFNEPHGVSWEIWRNGGIHKDEVVYGMQDLIEAVRDTGAKNICIVGGLDYAYILAGILENGGLLKDQRTGGGGAGNGIIYDTHIYPVKGGESSWEAAVKPMREVAPVIAGEWGYDPDDKEMLGSYKGTAEEFQSSLLEWFDRETGGYGSKMHWTAWSFHSSASPRIIKDNSTCEPTSFHGYYVYNKLQAIYNQTSSDVVDFVNSFEPDLFSNYRYVQEEGSAINSSVKNGSLNINFDKKVGPEKVALYADIPFDWDLSKLGEIHFEISNTNVSNDVTIRLGVQEKDGEDWSVDVKFYTGKSERIKINIADLRKKENQRGDGNFTREIKSIHIEVFNKGSGSFDLDSVTFRCSTSEYHEYINVFGTDIKLDPGVYQGPSTGDKMVPEIIDDADSTGGKGLKLNYARTEATSNWGGNFYLNMPSDDRWEHLSKTKEIKIRAKDISSGGDSHMHFTFKFEAEKEVGIGSRALRFNNLVDPDKKIYEVVIPWEEVTWSSNYEHMSMEDKIKEIQRIKVEIGSKGSGTVIFTHLEFSGEEYPLPPSAPYKVNQFEYLVDMDNNSLKKDYNWNGPEGAKYNGSIVNGAGINGSKAVKITYDIPTTVPYGGDVTFKFNPPIPEGALKGAHFVSFYIRAGQDTVERNVSIRFTGNNSSGTVNFVVPASPDGESNEWIYHKFYFDDIGISNPEDITTIKFIGATKSDEGPGYYYLDNLLFSTGNIEQSENLEFVNKFDPDIFTNWRDVKSGGGYPENWIKAKTVSGIGLNGTSALELSYDRTGLASWGGYVEADLPDAWDFVNNTMSYLNFWIRGQNEQARPSNFTISFYDANGNMLFSHKFQSIDNDWEHIVIPIYKDGAIVDLRDVAKIRFTADDDNKAGKLLIDDMVFTNYEVVRIEKYRPVKYVDTFDGSTLIRKVDQYKGWGNAEAGYYDYIRQSFVENEGMDGTRAMKIEVSASSWYSGEVFFSIPADSWNMRYPTHMEFDIKYEIPTDFPAGNEGGPCRKLNFNLSTEKVKDGKRFGFNVDLSGEEEGKWVRISIPLANFTDKSKNPVTPDDILGFTLTPGESGNIGDGSYGTVNYKTATLEQFHKALKKGIFYIDNITFTNMEGSRVVKVELEQNGKTLNNLSAANVGAVNVTTEIDNYSDSSEAATMVVVLYSKSNNSVQNIKVVSKIIPAVSEASVDDKQIKASINVTDPQNQYLKVFIWKDFSSMKTLDEQYIPIKW